MRILRVLRGIVRTALVWALVWVPVSLVLFGISMLLEGWALSGRQFGIVVLNYAITGAMNGAVFATVLAIAGRRRTFATLSLRWMALWGALGGLLFPLVVRAVVFRSMGVEIPPLQLIAGLATSAVVGAGLSMTMLSIARRAPDAPAIAPRTHAAIDAGAL